jgi:general secretion pathway protein M
MEQLKALFSEAQARYAALTERERNLVMIASGALAAFIIFIIFFSFSATASGYRRRTEDKIAKLKEVQELAESYREAERARQDVERQLGTGAVQLITFLEEKGTAAGLEIPTMNPKGDVALGDGKIIESAVEVTFTDVSISKLHSFLSDVERGPGVVKVKFLRIQPRPANETVTAWTAIASYHLKQ